MKTIEINLYTPKEIVRMIKNDVKTYCGIWHGWIKSREIRKKYNLHYRTMCSELSKMNEEDAEKFIACFPAELQDKMYFLIHGKRKATTPPGEFRI